MLRSQGDNFLAICHEHPGIISDGALALLDSAAGKFSPTATGRAAFKTYWLQRLHITNTRGTADLLNFKLPFALDQPVTSQAISPFIQHFPNCKIERDLLSSLSFFCCLVLVHSFIQQVKYYVVLLSLIVEFR